MRVVQSLDLSFRRLPMSVSRRLPLRPVQRKATNTSLIRDFRQTRLYRGEAACPLSSRRRHRERFDSIRKVSGGRSLANSRPRSSSASTASNHEGAIGVGRTCTEAGPRDRGLSGAADRPVVLDGDPRMLSAVSITASESVCTSGQLARCMVLREDAIVVGRGAGGGGSCWRDCWPPRVSDCRR